MSQNELQKGREKWHIKIFQECYSKISGMEVISDENPDFILKNKSEVIGLEHRRIVKPTDSTGYSLIQEEKVHQKTVNLACKTFFKNTGKFVEVTISFVSKTKINAKNLAQKIADVVERNIPSAETFRLIRKYDDDLNQVLPNEISKIRIYLSENLKGNYWSFDGGGIEAELKPELVQKVIDEKNQKLKNYRVCHPECMEYWLLLVVHGFRPSSWFSISDSFNTIQFAYDFEKVFLFDVQKRKYYELKKGPRV